MAKAPFNLRLLKPTTESLKAMRQVKSLDIFDGMTNNYHEDGLFSTTTFGRVGSPERDTNFGYIDIKALIFHPLIYRRLIDLKGLYGDIATGKAYAKWDGQKNDFVPALPEEDGAGTGFGFFAEKWQSIVFGETKSIRRRIALQFVEKYRSVAMVDKILVLPAGLRDIEVDEYGRTIEDEINDPYRRLIAVSNTLGNANSYDDPAFDPARLSLERAFTDIYDKIAEILYGKKGFVQAKWGSRRVFNGTRNVISSMDTVADYFGGLRSMSVINTQMGLYQTLKSALPVAVHLILTGVVSHVFAGADRDALLVNPKTLKAEYKSVGVETIDKWTTAAGIEKLIEVFENPKLRQKPVKIEGYYLGLVYSDDKHFKVFNDIEDLPKNLSRKNVHPMTYTELFYLSGYQKWYELYTFVTRYPVAGVGSMYPSQLYCRTTVKASAKIELDEAWEPKGAEFTAREFPDTGINAKFISTMAPHPAFLADLGGDYDGDTCSAETVYLKDSGEEIKRYLHSRSFAISASGKLVTSANNDTITLVLKSLLTTPA